MHFNLYEGLYPLRFHTPSCSLLSFHALLITNAFQVLQVDPEATEEELKKQYKRLSILLHPDKNPDNRDLASNAFEVSPPPPPPPPMNNIPYNNINMWNVSVTCYPLSSFIREGAVYKGRPVKWGRKILAHLRPQCLHVSAFGWPPPLGRLHFLKL